MKVARAMRHALAWFAAAGACLPAQILSANERPQLAKASEVANLPIRDVALGPDGLLTGQLLDEHLRPIADAAVTIQAKEQTIATTRTDANGAFAVAGLHGGMHQISTAETTRVYRLWSPGTAPPLAAPTAQIVSGPDVVRGQWGGGGMLDQMKVLATNPFVVGGVIAAAVAIPVIINNTDDSNSLLRRRTAREGAYFCRRPVFPV